MYTASWRDVVRRNLFGAAPPRRDRPYRLVIRLALIVFRLFRFHFDVRGSEHVPATGGAIISSNHVSFFDFTFLGLAALPQHRLVRFMAKSAVFDHWFAGRFMRAMQHIPVDRKAGAAAFETAVRALKDGEVVGVFPEATISRSFTVKELKAGAARMALDAGVPRLLLDNMTPDELRAAVELTAGRAELEASGGITLDTIRSVAETGVDYISVGALTHSAPALDVSLLLEPLE